MIARVVTSVHGHKLPVAEVCFGAARDGAFDVCLLPCRAIRVAEGGAMSIFKPNIEGFGRPHHVLSNGPDDEPISAILNEAKHVFEWHKEGLWTSEYKDGFASLLRPFLRNHPKLIRQVLALDERVFSMVAYRAIELEKEGDAGVTVAPDSSA